MEKRIKKLEERINTVRHNIEHFMKGKYIFSLSDILFFGIKTYTWQYFFEDEIMLETFGFTNTMELLMAKSSEAEELMDEEE